MNPHTGTSVIRVYQCSYTMPPAETGCPRVSWSGASGTAGQRVWDGVPSEVDQSHYCTQNPLSFHLCIFKCITCLPIIVPASDTLSRKVFPLFFFYYLFLASPKMCVSFAVSLSSLSEDTYRRWGQSSPSKHLPRVYNLQICVRLNRIGQEQKEAETQLIKCKYLQIFIYSVFKVCTNTDCNIIFVTRCFDLVIHLG